MGEARPEPWEPDLWVRTLGSAEVTARTLGLAKKPSLLELWGPDLQGRWVPGLFGAEK